MTETGEMQQSTGNGKQRETGFDTEEMIKKTRSVLRDRLDEQPYLVLGAAAAVGYILAAGVPRPVMSYLLRFGIRRGLRVGLSSVASAFLPGEGEDEV